MAKLIVAEAAKPIFSAINLNVHYRRTNLFCLSFSFPLLRRMQSSNLLEGLFLSSHALWILSADDLGNFSGKDQTIRAFQRKYL